MPESRSEPSHSERQSSAYPWLTIMAEGHVYADTRDCTPAELDRRMVIMQEISAGRLVLAEDAPRDTDDTTWIVLWVARCSRCNGTVDDDGGEYQSSPEKAVKLALGEYGEFERRDGKLVCSVCCLVEDEPDDA